MYYGAGLCGAAQLLEPRPLTAHEPQVAGTELQGLVFWFVLLDFSLALVGLFFSLPDFHFL